MSNMHLCIPHARKFVVNSQGLAKVEKEKINWITFLMLFVARQVGLKSLYLFELVSLSL